MKSDNIRPALIRVYAGNDCHAASGVIFNKIVISPIQPIVSSLVKDHDLHSIIRSLDKGQPFGIYDDAASQYRELRCVLVPPEGKKREIPMSLKFIFNSKPIRSTFDRLLTHSPSIKLSKDDVLSQEERTLLLSSFFAFELMDAISWPTNSQIPPLHGDGDFTVLATPYGNAIMQGSAFRCRVANVINDFLYLLDIPLSKYCEGGLLLTPSNEPLGMILTTTFESGNENLNLTFAADLKVIVQGLRKTQADEGTIQRLISWPTDTASKFVVLVESGPNSYGTGTLIRIGRRRLVLTCSHVVTHKEMNHCMWNGQRFPLRLIYQNPLFDRPFDVAVFEAPKEIPSTSFCQSAKSNPIVGSSVKSIGYPIFDPNVLREMNVQPSVYRGKLVNYRSGMVITDTMIQSGQSGGPLFDDQDRMVAIAVSNFRENDSGRVFPTLNCSVPMFNIISFLTEYCRTNDVACLKRLEGGSYLRRLWNFEEPVVHSKM